MLNKKKKTVEMVRSSIPLTCTPKLRKNPSTVSQNLQWSSHTDSVWPSLDRTFWFC